jgi:DNA modification methylase
MRATKRRQIGNCELYHGDCLTMLNQLQPLRYTIVTDPPYGIKQHHGNGSGTRERFKNEPQWDNNRPDIKPLLDFIDYAIVWGGNYFDLPPSRKYIVWDKGTNYRNNCFATCELAWCSWDGNAKIISYNHTAFGKGEFSLRKKVHPAQKPVAVMEFCLQQLPDSPFPILDPFMGSGTTAVAMIKSNMQRKFIGIEKEKKYFDQAVKRIRDAYKE